MKKILIVDDDEVNIDIFFEWFSDYDINKNYEIHTALTGKDAIEQYYKHLHDIILLDVMLGDITGYEVCRQIKVSGKKSKIIMISGRAMENDKSAGYNAGADYYIPKPFDVDDLIKLIEK